VKRPWGISRQQALMAVDVPPVGSNARNDVVPAAQTSRSEVIESHYRARFSYDVLRRVSTRQFNSVIDFGCGDGSILRLIMREVRAIKAKGIDLGVSEVRSSRISLCRGNLLEYVPTETYDLVISNQVFEHIYEPWLPKYFAVLKDSCALEGVILISTPNRWRPKNILRALVLRRPYMMSSNRGLPPAEHLGHHRECSFRELRGILGKYFDPNHWGFTIVRTVPRIIDSRPRWVGNILVYFLLWVFWRPLVISASQDHYAVLHRLR
jgi:SAM-dependent methyltransferase